MRIRKAVNELTPHDLDEYGVWEWALDEEDAEDQDETTMRPWEGELPLDAMDGQCIVRAKFTLADGTPMIGYISPPPAGDASLQTIQPVVVTEDGQIGFWLGLLPSIDETTTAYYQQLGKRADEVFPVRFVSDVPLAVGEVSGLINGFLYLPSIESQEPEESR